MKNNKIHRPTPGGLFGLTKSGYCGGLSPIRLFLIVQEYLATLYTPDHDLMQDTRSVNSS